MNADWTVCTQEGQAIGGVDNVLVTAASRGIIQREHQRGALFYKNYSLANPFDHVTKDDLDAYRREVERKEKRRAGESELYVELLENTSVMSCFMCSVWSAAFCCCQVKMIFCDHRLRQTSFVTSFQMNECMQLPPLTFFPQLLYKRTFGDRLSDRFLLARCCCCD